MEKDNALTFVYYFFKILWIAGTICFACFLLYYVVEWQIKTVSDSIWILVRIVIVTIVSYYLQLIFAKMLKINNQKPLN